MSIEVGFSRQNNRLIYYALERGDHERKKNKHKFWITKCDRENPPLMEFVRWFGSDVSGIPLMRLLR